MKFIHLFRCNIPLVASKQLWRTMRIFMVIMTAFLMQVSPSTNAQQLTIKDNHISLREVFRQIRKQTGYTVLAKSEVIAKTKPISLDINTMPLEEALKKILSAQNLEFTIKNKAIFISEIEKSIIDKVVDYFSNIDVRGKILDETGAPLVGASIMVKGGGGNATTNDKGEFSITNVKEDAVLQISFIGYVTKEVKASSDLSALRLEVNTAKLEEVRINAGYYSVTDRERTGNISRVTPAEIEKQPVSNPLQALQSRVPGLEITQLTGVAGGGFKVQIRGRSSINTQVGNDPLYIIDGVIYPSSKVSLSYVGNILGTAGTNPLSMVNPNDIKSIEVLKDADATAIYGSRGANGVILIKTKRGNTGVQKINAGFTQGFSQVASHIALLNTQQYLEMRNEALRNDGKVPSPTDYDINGTWDQNNYTDWQKQLIGGIAPSSKANLNFSGGSEKVNYLLGAAYYKEGTVYSGDFSFNRMGLQSSLNFGSEKNRLNVSFIANYNHTDNKQIRTDPTSFITMAPNAPEPYDQYGQLNWADNTVYQNPMAYLLAKNNISSNNLIGNIILNYKILNSLSFKASAGYNLMKTDEFNKLPLAYLSPANSPSAANRISFFSNISNQTWMVEPQLNYSATLGPGKLEALIGMSLQENIGDLRSVKAANFSSDQLMENIGAAALLTNNLSSYSQYRYLAGFARINYSIRDRYFLNLTARRDGSSRFGSDKQFANFGAVGAAWIFSEEKLIKSYLNFLSFGKLRASYGVTGNDQIPDYGYFQLYNTSGTYQGNSTIIPSTANIGNPDFAWETNYKMEIALQLNLLKDKIGIEVSWYRNRSSNQLIGDPLPLSTGSLTVRANRPAVVQNTGWEFLTNFELLNHQNWHWSAGINLSLPRNKLISYPGLEQSDDANSLIVGKPLSIYKIYKLKGVDPQTGLYDMEDHDGNGILDDNDRYQYKFIGQYFYGGLQSAISYKKFSLDFLIGFTKQNGNNYTSSQTIPGLWDSHDYPTANQPLYVLDRWRNTGDESAVQKFSTDDAFNSPYESARTYGGLNIADASYIRLKNISFAYALPSLWLSKMGIAKADLMLSGQNIFTITNYRGLDPETMSMSVLPPLKTWALGINVTF